MIGRYLDALAAAGEWQALDNVLQAQDWTTHSLRDDDGRCLLGHAATNERGGITVNSEAMGLADDFDLYGPNNDFDRMVKRFGLERTVRLIKQRAGKHTRVTVPIATVPV